MKKFICTIFVFFVVYSFVIPAQEKVDLQMVQKIKYEEYSNSKIMETLSYLTDVYGPRLTNSPNWFKAANWTKDELTKLGLVNANIEPWGTFGRGWSVESFSLVMTEPTYDRLIAYPEAWTNSTTGIISGTPVLMDVKDVSDLDQYKGKLKGAIVMLGGEREVEKRFEADARRLTDEDLAKLEKGRLGVTSRSNTVSGSASTLTSTLVPMLSFDSSCSGTGKST